jgi:hypothetical protein
MLANHTITPNAEFAVDTDVVVPPNATPQSDVLVVLRVRGCSCTASLFVPLATFQLRHEAFAGYAIDIIGRALTHGLVALAQRHTVDVEHAETDRLAATLLPSLQTCARALAAAIEAHAPCIAPDSVGLAMLHRIASRAVAQ